MNPEPGNDLDDPLDRHLDRLMETAYEALVAGPAAGGGAPPAAPAAELPDRIGPYPVTGLLGRGGTSFVYRGADPVLGRELAIKVIDRRHQPDGALAQRFLDEARICSQLPHPGIVPIYGVGQLDDGRPYITMRLVEGDTLGKLLDARTDPQDRLQQFLETFARVCETVAFAHARGVVHGDLKPGNVMVGAFGQVQVMDWGFSRLVDGPAAGGTGARVMGTPAFMAPEQAADHGASVDARTDVFGLGAILCVILTGAPPFLGGSRSEVHVRAAHAYVGDALARLRACGGDPQLVALAVDCLEPAPAARPAHAAAVAARVAAWIASIKERAHRLEVAAAQAQVKAAEQRRTRARTVALAVLGVVFAGVYAWTRFERQAHDYEARMAVVQALERARNLRAGADIAGAERRRWLGEAAQAAQQAKAFASTVGDPALRHDAEQLSQRLDDDRDAAARDEAMAKWLEDFPSHLDLTWDQLDLEFAAAFRTYGADVDVLPDDEVVARLRSGTIAAPLARALDDWGFVRRDRPGAHATAWRRFHDLALRVDEDPLRSAVRRALLAGDHDALRSFADAAAFAAAPTDTLDLLANCLAHAGQRRAAIQLWQRAYARHPDSVRVIHSLAVNWIGDATCPPWDDVVRLFTAGTALQPGSAHLWTDLGYALIGQGNLPAAEAALLRALEISPRDERALANLVDLLRCEGKPADLLARSRALAERAAAGGPWRVHGDALLLDGRVREALDAYRRAVALDGTGLHHERCGQCLLELGDLDAALQCFRTSIDVDAARASVHAHLGLALRLRGRFDEAVAALQRSRAAGDAAWAQRCDGWLAPGVRERLQRPARVDRRSGDAGRAAREVEPRHDRRHPGLRPRVRRVRQLRHRPRGHRRTGAAHDLVRLRARRRDDRRARWRQPAERTRHPVRRLHAAGDPGVRRHAAERGVGAADAVREPRGQQLADAAGAARRHRPGALLPGRLPRPGRGAGLLAVERPRDADSVATVAGKGRNVSHDRACASGRFERQLALPRSPALPSFRFARHLDYALIMSTARPVKRGGQTGYLGYTPDGPTRGHGFHGPDRTGDLGNTPSCHGRRQHADEEAVAMLSGSCAWRCRRPRT